MQRTIVTMQNVQSTNNYNIFKMYIQRHIRLQVGTKPKYIFALINNCLRIHNWNQGKVYRIQTNKKSFQMLQIGVFYRRLLPYTFTRAITNEQSDAGYCAN